ncbi:MAG TPA: TadE/TadG family type IV pilus assembly protein [Acidimicrobiales bacterium]|nr:TadE/TadG family type IV pilus assembly protein [Acidimicrobiales bacterium]
MIFHRGPKGTGRSGPDQRGSVLVEFAFVFVLFMLVIYALISFGMILAAKSSITHAAAEGARAAVGAVDDPLTIGVDERVERAKSRVAQSLSWFGAKYQPGDTTATVARCEPANPLNLSDCITVTVTYPYQSRPIVPPAPGLGLVTPNSFKSTAVVELT